MTKSKKSQPFREGPETYSPWWQTKQEVPKPAVVEAKHSMPNFKEPIFNTPSFPFQSQVRDSVWVEGAKDHAGAWWVEEERAHGPRKSRGHEGESTSCGAFLVRFLR